ncbi:SDR family NAD(P)-dependent oxidoreductase [Nocardia sp. R6R-6]|uniref:SDR family NAD(P)-dependent oxidoreductase n=1 Tax=Nocardia sp. R6R-6 TaxID=3459303 RepID=UPI00403D8953
MRIHDRVVLVTGGASGLGLATTQYLAAAGARVVLVDLPQSTGGTVAESSGGRIRFEPADVTDTETLGAAFETATNLGPLRAVVHAAGISLPTPVSGERPQEALEQFRRIVEVNLTGCFNVVQHAARAMAASEPLDGDRGVVITTASIAAFDGVNVAYSASKGGVAALTLPAARQLAAASIRVVSIAPGLFDTPMLNGQRESVGEQLIDAVQHPRRLGDPREFAALVGHIIENPMLNGEVIRLDGALRVTP